MSHTKSTQAIDHTLASREWLHQKYVTEGLGCPEIGVLVERDSKTVFYWLRKHGIQTRKRGHDVRQQFPKGLTPWMQGREHSVETKAKIGAASRERGAVPYLKDGVHHLKGKRGAVVANWKGGVTPERQTFYRSEAWKAACVVVWHREDARCARCGLDSRTVDLRINKHKFHVHHIRSFAVGETRCEPSNLVLLCRPCHLWVHSRANVNHEYLEGAA
jgi:hypothetical protein